MKFIFAILILLPALALTVDDPEKQLEVKLFQELDADKDGKISETESETFFLGFDVDKDGEITQAEFIGAIDKIDQRLAAEANALYKFFDQDKNKEVNKADIDAVFVLTDSNKDNKIEEAEFNAVFAAIFDTASG